MKHTWTHVTETTRSVHQLKIDGFSVTKATIKNKTDCIKSRCSVGGYDWEIQFYHAACNYMNDYWLGFVLVFLGGARTNSVTVNLSGRLVDQNCDLHPLEEGTISKIFQRPMDRTHPVYLARGTVKDVQLQQEPADYLRSSGSVTVECTITMVRDLNAISLPSSDLHQHLGNLLRNQAGVDVTFIVSGESFPAHKNLLAARSPIFMAEFFGAMVERSSQRVEIKDMDPTAFKAMLHFIYTDTVPEFDKQQDADAETVMAQHLLVAADRYGLDRLKVICEHRLSLGISVGTVASTLHLAEQHNCSALKAICIEFIAEGSSADLDDVLATEGYRHLEASSPSVLTQLLKAAHGKKRRRLKDSY